MESPAIHYASSVVPSAFSWTELERRAFAAHPDVASAIVQAIAARGVPTRGAARWWPVLVGLTEVVVLLAPILASGIIVAFGRGDSGVAFAVAGALAVAHLAIRVRQWARLARGIPTGSAREALLAAISIPFGVIAAVLAAMTGVLDPVPLIWLWFAMFIAMTLSNAIMIFVLRGASRNGLLEARTPDEMARAAVDGLPPAEREAVVADIRTALDILSDRRIVAAAERDGAAAAPVGGLARWAWARMRVARPR